MLGAFVSLNLFQFYVFWELMLIPMYFIIGIWGGPRRIYAAVKFFLFTMVGSLLMLVAILVIYYLNFEQHGRRRRPELRPRARARLAAPGAPRDRASRCSARRSGGRPSPGCSPPSRWPSPSRCRCSRSTPGSPTPTSRRRPAGSVILAGVLLKMGTYGFVRFALPLFPVAAAEYAPVIVRALAVVGILYGALVAMVQSDVKKLVAYSSVAHLGFVMLGTFALNAAGPRGQRAPDGEPRALHRGAVPAGRHALRAPPHPARSREFGGVAKPMPVYAALFGIVAMSSIGLPGAERLRRRVPDPARRLPREPGLHGAGDLRRGAGGGLPALGLPPHHVRPRRAAREPLADRPRPAREGGDGRDPDADRLDRRASRERAGEGPSGDHRPAPRDGDAQRRGRAPGQALARQAAIGAARD